MSKSPEDRKDHCIKLHKFPHDFRFDKFPSKKKTSTDLMDTSEDTSSTTVKPKITNFHFGHKSQKVFKNPSKKQNPLDSLNVDLKETLPEI